jgi:mRNA interferase MazF
VSIGQVIRYGIYWVDLDPPGKGHEQHSRRPCVVVSPTAMHRSKMTVVCPMTTRLRPWPFRLRVTCNGTLGEIMVDQIRAASFQRFDALIEVLAPKNVQLLRDLIARMYTV